MQPTTLLILKNTLRHIVLTNKIPAFLALFAVIQSTVLVGMSLLSPTPFDWIFYCILIVSLIFVLFSTWLNRSYYQKVWADEYAQQFPSAHTQLRALRATRRLID